MSRSQQKKGRVGELELCRVLQEYGFPVKVGDPMCFGSQPDLTGLKLIHVECKRTEAFRLYNALQQATNDSERFCDGLPTVFYRSNRKPWVVVMRLQDWVDLYKRGIENEKENC